jgi:integrase
MRLFIALAYNYGWRRGELIGLRTRQVSLVDRTIRLDPGTTENNEGREVPIPGPDGSAIPRVVRAACADKQPDDYVFTREDGSPIKDFRGAWHNLCVRAGVGSWECRACKTPLIDKANCQQCGGNKRHYTGLIPHDFRRSAARNLRRSGAHENVIMDIGGWKTSSMFRRYAIVNNDDKRRAMEALAKSRE